MKAEQIYVSPSISEKIAAFIVFKLRLKQYHCQIRSNNLVGKNGGSTQARVVRQLAVRLLQPQFLPLRFAPIAFYSLLVMVRPLVVERRELFFLFLEVLASQW